MNPINNQLLKEVLDVYVDKPIACEYLGLANCTMPNSLSFLDDARYLDELNSNSNVTTVLTTKSLAESIGGKLCLVREEPRIDFAALHNYLAKKAYQKTPSVIHETARIHPRAYVADYNVEIGENTEIEANANILPDVRMGANVIIRSGAVIGCEGFEPKRGNNRILSVFHDGKVLIEDNVEIGANSCICKGVYSRDTRVGKYTKTGCLVQIAHNVRIGQCCLIVSCASIAGSSEVGNHVWIGPKATISSQVSIGEYAFVALGSVITKDIPPGEIWIGNPARSIKK